MKIKFTSLELQQAEYGLSIKKPLPCDNKKYIGLYLERSYGNLVAKLPYGAQQNTQTSSIVVLYQVSGSGKLMGKKIEIYNFCVLFN